jgi:protein-tyrosine phosphatase
MSTVRVLFVCLGNICRSPTAEGVFQKLLDDCKLAHRFALDSAGTGGWHEGEPPDRRAQAEARKRGIDISGLRGREVRAGDFEAFDYILAMDKQNLRDLHARCPKELRGKVRLMLDFAPHLDTREVPDPYYGGADGFTHVFDLLEEAAQGLLTEIEGKHV